MITIRKPTLGEEVGIAEVHIRTWQTTYRSFVSSKFLDGLEADRKRRQDMWRGAIIKPERCALWVADENMQIVGFVAAGESRDTPKNIDGEIYAIYVLENYQKQGIGARLFAKARESLIALGHQSMSLWVVKGNPSENFYSQMGGTPNGEKDEEIAGIKVKEVQYVWKKIHP